jgi:hypothetical protein
MFISVAGLHGPNITAAIAETVRYGEGEVRMCAFQREGDEGGRETFFTRLVLNSVIDMSNIL